MSFFFFFLVLGVLNPHPAAGSLGKGCGKGLVLFQYLFITEVIMPKGKSNNFGNPTPGAYSVCFITNGCGSQTLA